MFLNVSEFWSAFSPTLLLAAVVLGFITEVGRVLWKKINKDPVGTIWAEAGHWIVFAGLILAVLWGIRFAAYAGPQVPLLSASIEYQLTGTIGTGPFVSLVVRVLNTGIQSTVGPYDLCLRFAGHTDEVCGGRQTIPETFLINLPNGSTMTLLGKDSLDRKTAEAPVQRGASVYGRLLYLFPSNQLADINAAGTVFILRYSNAWGKRYSTEVTTNGQRGSDLFDYPGITPQPMLQQNKQKDTKQGKQSKQPKHSSQ